MPFVGFSNYVEFATRIGPLTRNTYKTSFFNEPFHSFLSHASIIKLGDILLLLTIVVVSVVAIMRPKTTERFLLACAAIHAAFICFHPLSHIGTYMTMIPFLPLVISGLLKKSFMMSILFVLAWMFTLSPLSTYHDVTWHPLLANILTFAGKDFLMWIRFAAFLVIYSGMLLPALLKSGSIRE